MRKEIPILEMSKDEYLQMLDSKGYDLFSKYEPRGLFIVESEGKSFLAVDNLEGDAWVECFDTTKDAVSWLRGDFEITGPNEFEFNYEKGEDLDRIENESDEVYLSRMFERVAGIEDRWECGFFCGDENIRYEVFVYEEGATCNWRIYHSLSGDIISRGHGRFAEATKQILEDMKR